MSMSVSGSSEAIAAKMASSLGVTEIDVADISRMLELRHTLLPMFQVSVAFLVLAWFAVSLRVYARAFIMRSFHWDDWLILLTLCVFTACCSCLIAIENIERSDAARTALLNGLKAQFGLIDTIFGVSYMHTVWYRWPHAD
jgi:drug/metabolite transporter (DMT)-like permease